MGYHMTSTERASQKTTGKTQPVIGIELRPASTPTLATHETSALALTCRSKVVITAITMTTAKRLGKVAVSVLSGTILFPPWGIA